MGFRRGHDPALRIDDGTNRRRLIGIITWGTRNSERGATSKDRPLDKEKSAVPDASALWTRASRTALEVGLAGVVLLGPLFLHDVLVSIRNQVSAQVPKRHAVAVNTNVADLHSVLIVVPGIE